MIKHERDGLIFFSYKIFHPLEHVTNIISTRLGGVSAGPYFSLNIGLNVGDNDSKVVKNRQLLCKELNVELNSLTSCKQVHNSAVEVVNSMDKGKGGLKKKDAIDSSDGLITSLNDTPLLIFVADCVPLSFFDTKLKIIALAHGSWRGTLFRIAQKTVLKMENAFGCKKENIIVGIGPSIGPCCYKVKQDFVKLFNKEFPQIAHKFFVYNKAGTYCDLPMINKLQLQEIGIKKENIELSEICTGCSTDMFYSYRAEKGKTGRFCGLICLHKHANRNY